MKLTALILTILVFFINPFFLCAESRWEIQKDSSIIYKVQEGVEFSDHIEMSGEMLSCVLRYKITKEGGFEVHRTIVWPMLRKIPNNTRGGLIDRFAPNFLKSLALDGKKIMGNERVKTLRLDGLLTVESELYENASDSKPALALTRVFYPSPTKPLFCDFYTLKNVSGKVLSVELEPFFFEKRTEADKGVDGKIYVMKELSEHKEKVVRKLNVGESFSFGANLQAFVDGENPLVPNYIAELNARKKFVEEMWGKLVFESPDEVINKMFAFAKIRGAESIYKTAGGYMHGPGGENYYAAIWANDQAEYINPFFPFLGYALGNNSAYNSFMHWLRFINPEYKHIPASIIAEGKDHWSVAGDRGDAAMIAYGASRYALAKGDKKEAEAIWPLIEWCLEYCKRKIIEGGVVASKSDELEGRFPSGKANLCTSTLYYDALLSSSYLAKELGKPELVAAYKKEAQNLRESIENYFGGEVSGFKTYKYYEGNTVLRSWICMPLTVGIYERKKETVAALFSDYLWTKNGLLTQAGDKTFWDRSTLYALRGVFACGEREQGIKALKNYSLTRLLGEHVPYAIEAWPEGGQRHLSAESGLYCRVITEGLFGFRPTGFKSFELTPQLPDKWNKMSLKNIGAFVAGGFDVDIARVGANLSVKLLKEFKIKNGDTVPFSF